MPWIFSHPIPHPRLPCLQECSPPCASCSNQKSGCRLPLLTLLSYTGSHWELLMCSPENSTCLFSFHVCCPFSASGSLCLTGCGSRMWSRLHLGDHSGLCDGEWTEDEQHWAQEVGRLASLGFQEEGSIGTACLLGTWEAQLHRIRDQVTLCFFGFLQCLEEVIPPEQTSLLTCVLHLFTSFLSPGVLSFVLPSVLCWLKLACTFPIWRKAPS